MPEIPRANQALDAVEEPPIPEGSKNPVVPSNRSLLDRDGRELPKFVQGLPNDPALEPLIQAFLNGNFAYVRREAPRVANNASTPEVQAAVRDLYRRIQPDPLVKLFLGLALFVFCLIVAWAYATRHH